MVEFVSLCSFALENAVDFVIRSIGAEIFIPYLELCWVCISHGLSPWAEIRMGHKERSIITTVADSWAPGAYVDDEGSHILKYWMEGDSLNIKLINSTL